MKERLRQAYLTDALSRLGAAEPFDEESGVAEAISPYKNQRTVLRQLLYRMVDAALEQTEEGQDHLAEEADSWLDEELVQALGRPTEEILAFVRNEVPRLINLERLSRIMASGDPLAVSEAGVVLNKNGQPLLAGPKGKFRELLDQLKQVADNNFSVLITGPSGTGKELVSRRIHQLSPWRKGPFVPVDCAAIPHNLLEAELFGHEKGAFTGALRARPGKVELAAGGTLFLDEVAELPTFSQVKLLRFLQERVVERLGGGRPKKVQLRVIAATSRNLEQLMAEERFREDLYYRLATLPLHVPPLKDRPEDLPVLLEHYLTQAQVETRKTRRLSKRVMNLFLGYNYPGNIRELINFINNTVALSQRHTIDLDDLPEPVADRLLSSGQDKTGSLLDVMEKLSLSDKVRPATARFLVEHQGELIANADLRRALDCSDSTAKTILARLSEAGLVVSEGHRGGRRYCVVKIDEEKDK